MIYERFDTRYTVIPNGLFGNKVVLFDENEPGVYESRTDVLKSLDTQTELYNTSANLRSRGDQVYAVPYNRPTPSFYLNLLNPL